MLNVELVNRARRAVDNLSNAELGLQRARADYVQAIRDLQASGGSLREIARVLGISHQRVHQILDSGAPRRRRLFHRPPPAAVRQRDLCSLCAAATTAGRIVMHGPTARVCSDCTTLLAAVAQDRATRSTSIGEVVFAEAGHSPVPCMLCADDRSASSTSAVVVAGTHRICLSCLGLCRDIVAEELP